MKKLLYILCFISQMIFAGEAAVYTKEIAQHAHDAAYAALQELACTSLGTPFEDIFYERWNEFEEIRKEKDTSSLEDLIERWGELYCNIPKITKNANTIQIVYPVDFDDQGQIIYQSR